MKVHFIASIVGRKQFEENYIKIVAQIKHSGFALITDHVLKKKPEEIFTENAEEMRQYYKNLINWIKTADIIVVEASFPSTGIGHELSLAIQHGKPVIVLRQKGENPYFLEGVDEDKLQVVEYTMEDLERRLKEALQSAKDQMDVRFNFFVSPKIVNYLDWIAKQKRMPRAVYLRKLIEEDIKLNTEFLEE